MKLILCDMTKQELNDLVDLHCAQLSEHFDSVRIFCSKHDSENEGQGATQGYTRGRGNYYAQRGQIADWLVDQTEETRDVRRLINRGEAEDDGLSDNE